MPILVNRNVDPDAQVRFQTYRHYLVNLQYFTQHSYGQGSSAYAPLTSAQQACSSFARIQRRTLATGERRSVERSLRMAWAHETSLRLRGQQPPDVLHVLLHLALPEAYYSLYHATQAYMTASGMDVPIEHTKTLNVLSSRATSGQIFPPPWDIFCVGDPRPAAHSCTFLALPPGTTLTAVNQLTTPTLARFYDLHATCLKSTREAFGLKTSLDHKRRQKLKRLPNGFASRYYSGAPPTSLFHFMYRLRLRSNYRDADAFLQGVWTPHEARDFFGALLEVVGATLLLLENLTMAYTGPEPLSSTLRSFALADTTNVERRSLDDRHPGIV